MVTEVREYTIEEKASGFGAAINTAMVEAGDEFGLYDAMAASGPVTPAELAELTGIPWQHARLWLSAQAAGDFLYHDEATGRYSLSCPWPRGHADGHTYRGDAVRRFVR